MGAISVTDCASFLAKKPANRLSAAAFTSDAISVKDPKLPSIVVNGDIQVREGDCVDNDRLSVELGALLTLVSKELISTKQQLSDANSRLALQGSHEAQNSSSTAPATQQKSAAVTAAIEVARRKGASLLNPRVKKQATGKKSSALFDEDETDDD